MYADYSAKSQVNYDTWIIAEKMFNLNWLINNQSNQVKSVNMKSFGSVVFFKNLCQELDENILGTLSNVN